MKILICGCIHGEYDKVLLLQKYYDPDVSILLGDLQTFVNEDSLKSSLLPPKYRTIGKFPNALSGQLKYPTIAIHGNHEDSAFLSAFPNGGFLAKNMFYIGQSTDLRFVKGGKYLQFYGISGIKSTQDSFPGFDEFSIRAKSFKGEDLAWHTKASLSATEYVVERAKVYKSHAIFASHDWPANVCKQIKKEELRTRHSNLIGSDCGGQCSRLLFDSVQSFNSVYACAHMHFYCSTRVNAKGYPNRQFLALNKLTYDKIDLETGTPLNKCTGHQLIEMPGQKIDLSDGIWVYNRFINGYQNIDAYNNIYTPNEVRVDQETGKTIQWNSNAIEFTKQQ